MKEKDSGTWRTFGNYKYFVSKGDWVDEDYAPYMIERLKQFQTDLIICGVIRVYKNQFKRANFYEYEKILQGKAGRKELLLTGYMENTFCGCLVKKDILREEAETLYDLLLRNDKIGIINDYKYYRKEEVKTPMTFMGLKDKWKTYQSVLVDWKEDEKWELFTRKEKLLLQHAHLGRIICGCSTVLQNRCPYFYKKIQRTIDVQLEKIKRKNHVFQKEWKNGEKKGRIFIMGTPQYHNLGDHAIAYAQEKFCKQYFPNKEVITITEETIVLEFHFLQTQIKEADILLLQGGGNMGDEYECIEKLRLRVIKGFPHNKIVLMPQTLHFTDSSKAQTLCNQMKKTYGRHENLILTAREKTSFKRMQRYFPNNTVILCPDMVMSLEIQKKLGDTKREGILLLLRTDSEGTLDLKQLLELKHLCVSSEKKFKMAETSVSYSILEQCREEELMKKFQQISAAQLVITDRLHGMVFAAITGTPCLVLSNYNHKIRESYEWIKGLEYIKFCKSLSELKSEFDKMQQVCKKTYCYHNEELLPYYEDLCQVIRQPIERGSQKCPE